VDTRGLPQIDERQTGLTAATSKGRTPRTDKRPAASLFTTECLLWSVLKPGGKLVWIAPAADGFQPSRTDVQTLRPNVVRDRAHLGRMLALLDAGAVRPPTIVRYQLADAAEAHRVSEARHLQGKLVLEVR
jgi:D-arabinose 1-dehydrogenase-like Zn-dependent alcohol dehydrogenase